MGASNFYRGHDSVTELRGGGRNAAEVLSLVKPNEFDDHRLHARELLQ